MPPKARNPKRVLKVKRKPSATDAMPTVTDAYKPHFVQAMEQALRLQNERDSVGEEALRSLKDTVCALEGEYDILEDTVYKRIKRLSLASRHELGKVLHPSSELVNTDADDLTKDLLAFMHSLCVDAMAEAGKPLAGTKYHKVQVVLGTSFLFIEKELNQVVESKWKKIEAVAPAAAESVQSCGDMCLKKFMQTVLVVTNFLPADIAQPLTDTASLCITSMTKKDKSICRLAVCIICQYLSKYNEASYSPLIWAPLSLLKWACRSHLGKEGCSSVEESYLKLDKDTQKYLEKHTGVNLAWITGKKIEKISRIEKLVDGVKDYLSWMGSDKDYADYSDIF